MRICQPSAGFRAWQSSRWQAINFWRAISCCRPQAGLEGSKWVFAKSCILCPPRLSSVSWSCCASSALSSTHNLGPVQHEYSAYHPWDSIITATSLCNQNFCWEASICRDISCFDCRSLIYQGVQRWNWDWLRLWPCFLSWLSWEWLNAMDSGDMDSGEEWALWFVALHVVNSSISFYLGQTPSKTPPSYSVLMTFSRALKALPFSLLMPILHHAKSL